ncbi:MAG: hypothetical protein ACTHKE_01990 [Sphingomicrobium sp.]
MYVNRYKRTSALPAIAAALALSSTPVLAQEVQPVPTDPAPAAQPAPTPDATTPATTTNSGPAVQPDVPMADTSTAKTATKTKSGTRRPAVKTAPVVHTASRTMTTRTVAPAPAPAARPTIAAVPATAPASTRPAPIVDLNAKPQPTTPAVAAKPAKKKPDPTLPIAGGALAFLALGGAAAAMTRRRSDEEEEWVGDGPEAVTDEEPVISAPTVVHEEQPNIVAPAAFAWDGVERPRRDGESHVDRAYRGPTPDNPSLSLRKRLKRAAFMDKRERDAAAGLAAPVDPTAGLPDRMVTEQQGRPEVDQA